MDTVAETAAVLTLLVSAMVEDRSAVKGTIPPGQGGSVVFVLEVAQKDRGKILDKQGKTDSLT